MDYLALHNMPNGPVNASTQQSYQATTQPCPSFDRIELVSQGPKATIRSSSLNEPHCDERSNNRLSNLLGSSDRACEYDSASPSSSPSCSPSRSPSPRPQKTILDKPLEQLTEEDILHLTREDCRRYLKEKGMRRPSWNKSQAIQQVLSLKGLFDSNEDTQKSLRPSLWLRKLTKELPVSKEYQAVCMAPPHQLPSPMSHHSCSGINMGSERSQELCIISDGGHEGHDRIDITAIHQPDLACPTMPTIKKHPSSMSIYTWPSSNEPALCHTGSDLLAKDGGSNYVQSQIVSGMKPSSQLTIFYSGIVNVYDNVPADKAKDILLLAAHSNNLKSSCLQSCHDVPVTAFDTAPDSHPAATQHVLSKLTTETAPLISQSSRVLHPEPQSSRKACLQRYLEKRRGRYHAKAPYHTSSKGAEGEHPPQLVPRFSTVFQMAFPYYHQGQLPIQSSGSETSSPKMTLRLSS